MEVLKKYRIKNKLSYQAMGNLLGISKTFYWQIENKKRRLYYKVAIKIARVFNLKPDDIFYDSFN